MFSANVEIRSALAVAHCYSRSFTFYLGNSFARLKLARLPFSLVATLADFTFYLGNPFPRFLRS